MTFPSLKLTTYGTKLSKPILRCNPQAIWQNCDLRRLMLLFCSGVNSFWQVRNWLCQRWKWCYILLLTFLQIGGCSLRGEVTSLPGIEKFGMCRTERDQRTSHYNSNIFHERSVQMQEHCSLHKKIEVIRSCSISHYADQSHAGAITFSWSQRRTASAPSKTCTSC